MQNLDTKFFLDGYDCDMTQHNVHIQLTTFCPMGCVGCYQTTIHQKKFLDLDTLTKNFHDIIINTEPNKIKLSLFGGEPLIAIKTITEFLNHIKFVLSLKPDSELWLPIYKWYKNINEIYIPTSGGPKGKLIKNNIQDLIDLTLDLQIKLSVSVSFDGIWNEELRNVSVDEILNIYGFIKEKESENNVKILSDMISIVIPQNIDEDYFTKNFEYIYSKLGKRCTFTLPHIIDKTGNLWSDQKIFQLSVRKILNLYYGTEIWKTHAPKLFDDYMSKIKTNHKFNWCGAGVNHFAITIDKGIQSCDYIIKPAPELLKAMDNHCNKCEIKDYCQRPCLKNLELPEESFLKQCTLRKIIFNELKNKITTLGFK